MRLVREQLLNAADLTEVVNPDNCQILMKMQITLPESSLLSLNANWTKCKLQVATNLI